MLDLSRETLLQILEASPHFILLLDDSLRIVFLNRTQAGLSPEDFLGRNVLDDVAEVERRQTAEIYSQVLRDGLPRVHEVFALAGPGTYGRYRVATARIDIDGKPHLLVQSSDTSAEWLREKSLDYLWQSSPLMMHALDAEGRILDVSRAWTEKMEYTREEVLGRPVKEFLVAESAAKVERDWDGFLATSRIKDSARTFRRKNGGTLDTELYSTVLRDPSGNLFRIVSVFFDVTERNRAARSKSEFLAVMSHELRTPLNGILGLAQLLDGHSDVQGEARGMVSSLASSAGTLRVLIDNILDFLKIEQGQVLLDSVEFSLASLAAEAVDLVQDPANAKGLSLKLDGSRGPGDFFIGDRTKILQILINLLSNAVKFTPAGSVSLGVHSHPAGVLFEVRDTGIGIPEEVLPTLFQHFTQADATISRRFGGSGLGLAISRKLVELLGGSIFAQSRPGEGSIFSVVLPLRPAEKKLFDLEELRGSQALIADSDESFRIPLKQLLEHMGLAVTECQDALHAMQIWSASEMDEFCCVFLGADLPVINGARLSELFRESKPGSKARIFICGRDHARRAVRAGTVFLPGPITHQGLAAAIQHAFSVPPPAAKPDYAAQDVSVLVAEDNEVNQTVMRAAMRKIGIEPVIVANGIEAVEAAKSRRFDLIFMDIHMPEMDGYSAASLIRSEEGPSRAAKIIALSADAFDSTREASLRAGMDGFLRKPASLEDITNAVVLAVSARSPA